MSQIKQHDVIIIGGGMVGSMVAAALATAPLHPKAKLSVCVVEHQWPHEFPLGDDPAYDLRVSALSLAAKNMLHHVGAWQGIVERRVCPYARMSVWDGEKHGRTDFNSADIGADGLGYIVENRVIQLALLERLKALDNVTLCCPASLEGFHLTTDAVEVQLSDGSKHSAALLVGADGARSKVRTLAGIEMTSHAYTHHALVATVETQLPQQDITWQRFVATGPQAFLPLCGNRASLVWYHNAESVAELLALSDEAFLQQLHAQFPSELGTVERLEGRASFPIAKAHAKHYVQERVALVGDAAHTVHPLAGQGVNLGLLDAAALSEVVLNASVKGRDVGTQKQLKRYERWRRAENELMIAALDGIFNLFDHQPAPIQHIRSGALNAVNVVSPLKKQVMRHAMGVSGDLPALALSKV